jgi:hypothetical protein
MYFGFLYVRVSAILFLLSFSLWFGYETLYIPDIKDVNKYMILILVLCVCVRELHAFTSLSSPSLRSRPPPDQNCVVLPAGPLTIAGGFLSSSRMKKERFSSQAGRWKREKTE